MSGPDVQPAINNPGTCPPRSTGAASPRNQRAPTACVPVAALRPPAAAGIATYCPLEVLTGDPSAVSLNYAGPYALNSSKLTAPVVTAFNMLFDNMQTTGYYGSNIEPLYYTFDRDPSLCGPYQASLQPAVIPGAQPLMLEDLAGLFILQAIGAGLGLVSLILERTVHKLLKHRASRRDAEAGEGGAAPAELPEADKIPASEI